MSLFDFGEKYAWPYSTNLLNDEVKELVEEDEEEPEEFEEEQVNGSPVTVLNNVC